MENYVYIISHKVGQRDRILISVWADFDDALLAYREVLDDWFNMDYYVLHKIPLGVSLKIGDKKEQLGLSSKNRVKMKEEEILEHVARIKRERNLSELGI
jgi:hypothetical protein